MQVGIGLRSEHIASAVKREFIAPWFEVHTENYLAMHSFARHQLRQIAQHTPISLHGVGLSLGSSSKINSQHLANIGHLVNEIEPVRVSEHLSWGEFSGQYFNDLLPVALSEDALSNMVSHVQQVQEQLGRKILIENPSQYLDFMEQDYDEAAFLSQLSRRAGCELLLDINNIYVSAQNLGLNAGDYIEQVDWSQVGQIHLAGHTRNQVIVQGERREIFIDSHNAPVSEEVWQLYREALIANEQQGLSPIESMIEWDSELPDFTVLLEQAQLAQNIMDQTLNSKRLYGALL